MSLFVDWFLIVDCSRKALVRMSLQQQLQQQQQQSEDVSATTIIHKNTLNTFIADILCGDWSLNKVNGDTWMYCIRMWMNVRWWYLHRIHESNTRWMHTLCMYLKGVCDTNGDRCIMQKACEQCRTLGHHITSISGHQIPRYQGSLAIQIQGRSYHPVTGPATDYNFSANVNGGSSGVVGICWGLCGHLMDRKNYSSYNLNWYLMNRMKSYFEMVLRYTMNKIVKLEF